MLTDLIIRYLESNKRLVIPQLGAFVVKSSEGRVVFSELLRRDDGVLRGLLREEGMGELEAAGVVDRFVFEVRHTVQEGRDYPLAGLGVLRGGPEGTIVFSYAPRFAPNEALENGGSEVAASIAEGTGPAAATSASSPASRNGNTRRSISAPEEGKTPARTSRSAERIETPSSKLRTDPSVKGLRYGKPIRTTDAYTYVGAAPRRRIDKLILVAIIAAVIALAAIAYGYIRELQAQSEADSFPELLFSPDPSVPQTAPAPTETQNDK